MKKGKKMKKHFILLLTYFLLKSSAAVADGDTPVGLKYEDILPDFNQITPEAASLGKYGTIGMSEYTGVPDIKVPLFDIKAGELSVPIYLYYDASGIKVEQEATFVGLGWNLSYGGCITHIVCGKDDFLKTPSTTESRCLHLLDSLLEEQWKNIPKISEESKLIIPLDKAISLPLEWQRIKMFFHDEVYIFRFQKKGDSEVAKVLEEISEGYHIPDIFQASFCGHSVSFILDPVTREPVVIGDDASKYRIEYTRENSRYPDTYTITDSNGTVYRFVSFCEYDGRKDNYFLESVTDYTGQDWIRYCYTQNDLKMISQLTFYQTTGKAIDDGRHYLLDKTKSIYVDEHDSWGGETYAMNKVYPTRIETPQETVTFSYEERTDALHGLRVKDITFVSKNGAMDTHRAELQYDYFKEERSGGLSTDISTPKVFENARERLKLTGVVVDGKRYGFMYDERHLLPYRTSLSQDFWGYYNGANNKKKFCATPRYKLHYEGLSEVPYVGEANRYSSAEYCATGVLNRIVYPTGGYSLFEYEVNHFDDPNFFYYTDAKLFHNESNFMKITMLASTCAISDVTKDNSAHEASFTLDEEMDVRIKFGLQSDGNTGCFVRLSDSKDISLLKRTTTNQVKRIDGDTLLHLPAGTYRLESNSPYKKSSVFIFASITAESVSLRNQPYHSVADESGSSIGGGLRIKSIKNYSGDSNDHFLGGTEYKYQGGKLLVPTVYAQFKEIDETYDSNQTAAATADKRLVPIEAEYRHVKSCCYAVGSNPTFPAICSVGTPTVGYSTVINQKINKDSTIGERTITHFHNLGYSLFAQSNYFIDPNLGLNGKPKEVSIVSADGTICRKIQYRYAQSASKMILFPLVQKKFFWGPLLPATNYQLSAYPKANVWNYLTSKSETQYVDGKPMTPIVTEYAYNGDNYQPSQSKRRQGSQAIKDIYQYPTDGVSAGSDLLMDKHILSRLTGTRQYLNDRLRGGSQLDFKQHDSIPVVERYRRILPDGNSVTELTVVEYDAHGNICEYVSKDGIHVTLLWSYNYQYPVMQIQNATYKQVLSASNAVATLGAKSSLSVNELKALHLAVKNALPKALVSAYAYDAWYGVSDIINPIGKVMHYDKDSQGRLSAIMEDSQSGPVLQRFFYNYRTK